MISKSAKMPVSLLRSLALGAEYRDSGKYRKLQEEWHHETEIFNHKRQTK